MSRVFIKRLENIEYRNPPGGRWFRVNRLHSTYKIGTVLAAVQKYTKVEITPENKDAYIITQEAYEWLRGGTYKVTKYENNKAISWIVVLEH